MSRLIVWGAGELGGRVAERCTDGEVIGLTKTTRRHAHLRALGVDARVGSAVPLLQKQDRLLISLPGTETKAEALSALTTVAPPRRIILISTTGYYDPPSGLIDETTPAGPSARAQRIADLERDFMNWAGDSGVIVRLGGLYGSGRGPMAALARRGTAALKPPNKTLPLIHYQDAAQAVSAALQHPQPAPVYLAVTPPCPTRRQFYEAACARLDLALPAFEDPLPTGPATYDVSRLRRDLLPDPAYPDWRAVLASVQTG